MANVIEVLLRTKDQTATGLNKFKSSINGLKVAIGGLAASFAFGAIIRNIEEAEAATAQLDTAFKATGANAKVTRASLDELATSIQRTTTYSDDLVKQAESILLTFRQVRGDAFERTIKVSTDLAARLGVDLVSAVRQVGRAINDPVQGLSLLRRSGIQFTESQTSLIKSLVETGQAARAQNLILTELEKRYRGSAEAARNTLGGAITGLKNAFGDLFEGTKESTSGVTGAINDLSKTLSDPAFKEGMDILVTGFLKLVSLLPKAIAGIAEFDRQASDLVQGPNVRGFLAAVGAAGGVSGVAAQGLLAMTARDATRDQRVSPYGGRGQRGGSTESFDDVPAIPQIEEFTVTVQKIKEEYQGLLDEMEKSTRTSTQKQAADFIKLRTNLEFLRDEKIISPEEFSKRLGEAQDELLPLFDLNEIKAKYKSVKQETTEMGEFMKGVWQGVGQSIQSTFSDAIYEGKLSLKSLVDIARRAVADILSAFVTSGIKKYIGTLFSGAGGGSSGSSTAGIVAGLVGAFAAGGGSQRGPRIVGEDGPELDMGSSRIYNRRQLAFAGAGGGVTFAPVTNIQIIERDNPDRTKQEIFQTVATENARQQAEFIRTLQRSGVEVKG